MLSLLEGAAVASVLGFLLTGVVLVSASTRAPRPAAPLLDGDAIARAVPILTGDSLAPVVARNPFRVSRSPAPLPFDPIQPVSVQEAPAPKPQFTVSGILWGAAPLAFVEGFPGVEGARVVRVKEKVGAFQVGRITRELVTIHGLDTTWNLTIREPWR